jgi:mannitol/fructose-specific phosphotransferase system IIA component (Ntr-type)
MGLSRDGLALETPDGRPVECMVLFATSPAERGRHLQVLATLARTIGMDPSFKDRLLDADSPAHAAEILHGEESDQFNVFLDD